MSKEIIKLSEHTINQIAAGEVIEDPASVVKELVENGLDAGADEIRVEIGGSGFQLIRISDNGHGMDEGALRLCLERHATSKIRAVEDLERVVSMGFRGEALAAISAIAKVEIISATGAGEGRRLCESGIKAESRQRGTTVEVRQLFYNVPARLKFQKSPASCQGEITRWMTRLALGFPSVSFSLIADGKEIISVRGGELDSRIEELLGSGFRKELMPVNYTEGSLRIEGYIGKPECSRQNRSGQYFLLNQRAINSQVLSHALQMAYGTMIPPKTHPPCVLHIQIPPPEIDVNVHPQKREVRICDEGKLRRAIDRAARSSWKVEIPVFDGPINYIPSFTASEVDFLPMAFGEETHFALEVKEEVLGVFETYALVKGEEGLVFVDLVAASQRIYFEERKKGVKGVERLLFPKQIEIPLHHAEKVNRNLEGLEKIGVEIRPFGNRVFLIEGIAKQLDLDKVAEMLQEWEGEEGREEALFACRAVKRKGFNRIEAEAILRELRECETPSLSPLGSPTRITVTHEEIRKRFS